MGSDELVSAMILTRSRAAIALSLLLAPAMAVAQTATPPTADVTEEPPPPPPPDKLKVGKEGYFQPSILLQAWLFADNGPVASDPMSTVTTDAFRIRRAELHAKGQIIPDKVQYELHLDVAKVLEPKTTVIPTDPPTSIKEPQSRLGALQDVYLTYLTEHAEISVGQFKIPVSWEGLNSSSKLLFPERARVSREFGDLRDMGIRVTKKFDKFMYMAGVFNGTGANTPDNNKGKDVTLRLEAYPIEGLTIAAVTYDSVFDRKQVGAKDRWEFDVRYEKDAFLVQAEALVARDFKVAGTQIDGRGMYAAFGYKLPNNLQPVLRVGAFEPNADVDDDEELTVDLGANYYLKEHQAKIQAAYSRTQFKGDKAAGNLVILSGQISY